MIERNSNQKKQMNNYDYDEIDSLIDNLSRLQFSILSSISCDDSLEDIAGDLYQSIDDIKNEISKIPFLMEAEDLDSAVSKYGFWIEFYEKNKFRELLTI